MSVENSGMTQYGTKTLNFGEFNFHTEIYPHVGG
jgi:hypothetical protein